MARHALLHNLFHLTRTRHDRVVVDRARAVSGPEAAAAARRVERRAPRARRASSIVDFDELLAVPDTAPIVATLLRRTPLTQLLDSHPGAPPLHWEDAVFVLRDRRARARGRVSHRARWRRRAIRSRARRGSRRRSSRCSSARPTRPTCARSPRSSSTSARCSRSPSCRTSPRGPHMMTRSPTRSRRCSRRCSPPSAPGNARAA